jgi:hypothetical protein
MIFGLELIEPFGQRIGKIIAIDDGEFLDESGEGGVHFELVRPNILVVFGSFGGSFFGLFEFARAGVVGIFGENGNEITEDGVDFCCLGHGSFGSFQTRVINPQAETRCFRVGSRVGFAWCY